MKTPLLLFLLFVSTTAIALADEISLPDGRALHHARIAKFYAGEFVIEHDGGIVHVPWSKMAPEIKERYRFDADTVASEREEAQARIVEQKLTIARLKADQQEKDRIAALRKVLVYGKVVQVKDDFVRVDCAIATLTHPTSAIIGVEPSQKRDIYVPKDGLARNWKFGDTISLIGREDGTFTYTTISGQERTVPRITHWEELPPYASLANAGELIHLPTK